MEIFEKIVVIYGFTSIFSKIQPLAIDKIRNLAHAKEAPGGEKAPPGTPRGERRSPRPLRSPRSPYGRRVTSLRHVNTKHKHKPLGRSVCVLWLRLPSFFSVSSRLLLSSCSICIIKSLHFYIFCLSTYILFYGIIYTNQ